MLLASLPRHLAVVLPPRRLIGLASLLLASAAALPAQTVLIDTDHEGVADSRPISAAGSTYFGQQFVTAADISSLQGVGGATSFSLVVTLSTASAYVPLVQIVNDDGNRPGSTVLATFSYSGGAIDTASTATYTVSGTATLSASTTYWLTYGASSGSATMPRGDDGFYDGPWTTYVAYTSDGSGMTDTEGYPLVVLTGQAVAVPEPSTYALLAGAAGLGVVLLARRARRA
jgi:hypothetical protein